uniref:NTR domain-containing protein n=1 Tax=Plectus sambesii TaxID=2011161 RepID=A0A914X745_9BILA
MATKFPIILILAISWMTRSDACSCVPESVIQGLCNADFVSLVVVRSRKPFGDFEITYIIEHKSIFLKNDQFVKSSNTTLLKTANDPSTCGVVLDMQKTQDENSYLLSGRVDEKGSWLHLGLCTSIAVPWRQLHAKDREFLEEGNLSKVCNAPNLQTVESGLPPAQIFVGFRNLSRIRR